MTASTETPTLTPWRVERKFLVPSGWGHSAEHLVRTMPGIFQEAFPPRTVSSLYFDTPDLRHYRESVAGVRSRHKVRLRWYGTPDSALTLEVKEKQGWASRKRLFPLGPAPDAPDTAALERALRSAVPHAPEELQLSGLLPVLFVHYERRYYQAAARPLRVTIDSALRYAPVSGASPMPPGDASALLELKCPLEIEEQVRRPSGLIPFRLSRSSKYAQGLEALRGG